MKGKKFVTYEEPFEGETFTESEMADLYEQEVNKEEYPDFECWMIDMLKSGVFEEVTA